MPNIVVEGHVADPETYETIMRGTHEVEEAQAYRLTQSYPELVRYADELAGAKKDELARAASAAGVPVEGGETKEDLAKKLGAK